ncbi:MAG: sensor histidine kinase [Bacteroidales bacterium]
MSSKKIRLIIILQLICLIVIIGFQIKWISNAYQLKKEQFDRTTIEAMNKAVEKLSNRDVITFITSTIDNCRDLNDSILDNVDNFTDTLVQSLNFFDISEKRNHKSEDDKIKIVIKTDCCSKKTNADSLPQNFTTKTIIKFIDKADTLLPKQKRDKKDNFLKIVDQMVMEYTNRNTPVLQRIDKKELSKLLNQEFKNKNINLPFEFKIISNPAEVDDTTKADSFAKNYRNETYKVNLFPNDIINKPDYLLIRFNGKNNYIIGTMWIMLIASFLFSFVILTTFIYTILYIIKQKKLSDIKTDFINNMTHEFKTPIATISLASDAIINEKVINDKTQIEDFIRIIKEENHRMNTHVEHVLQMALFEKKEFNLKPEDIDLHLLLMDAISKIRLQLENRDGKIITDFIDKTIILNGDFNHLLNVFINILENAIKYTEVSPIINIKTMIYQQKVIVSISDNGIGISKEHLSKIFEKFYRIAKGNVHNVKGFGLGLSYVKAMVMAHNGNIKVKSELGKGSCFEVILPLTNTKNSYAK